MKKLLAPGFAIMAAAILTVTGCGPKFNGPVASMPLTPAISQAAASTATTEGRKPTAAQWVTVTGKVTKLLPDDNQGSKHQHFLFTSPSQAKTLKVAHNTDLAAYVPVKVGDTIEVKCEFIVSNPYDIAHWTHYDPMGGEGGYIKLNGKIYDRLPTRR
ncbi:MAG: DUF3465 domain-containing protein [Candidatus Sericytochromatia bacterium]|nr:DUF3465 domain-containing protein [Candidatus Sericytochromatia bacterium]